MPPNRQGVGRSRGRAHQFPPAQTSECPQPRRLRGEQSGWNLCSPGDPRASPLAPIKLDASLTHGLTQSLPTLFLSNNRGSWLPSPAHCLQFCARVFVTPSQLPPRHRDEYAIPSVEGKVFSGRMHHQAGPQGWVRRARRAPVGRMLREEPNCRRSICRALQAGRAPGGWRGPTTQEVLLRELFLLLHVTGKRDHVELWNPALTRVIIAALS